ncbi:hypothetical protein BBP40_001000 [Aspergillus hancockii]|nr:hypothetical protein BBP40_001000 [Aspergillus hancockii]
MSFAKSILALTVALASLGRAYAKLDLNSTSNVAVYWGQNSFNGQGKLAQQRLAHYCDGGAPEFDFANAGDRCTKFEGTNLMKCPQMEADINTCQKKGKTIILSIGGATYSEGGFQSQAAAKAGADLIWKTFGPVKTGGTPSGTPSSTPSITSSSTPSSTPHVTRPVLNNGSITNAPYSNKTSRYPAGRFNRFNPFHRSNSTGIHGVRAKSGTIHRPFGNATVDGFDFDFEAKVTHMAAFANRLRELSDADRSRKYYLTAAPQCPYPDVADKDILHGPVSIDAVFVQFYNNWCGVNSFSEGQQTQNSFNFEEWDNWAKSVSKNKHVKVLVGVPANTNAASTGYVPASKLEAVIAYSKSFSSFGGVMMWDVTQAYGNQGFLDGVKNTLMKSKSRLLRHDYRLPSILR